MLVNSKKTFGNFLKNIVGKKIYSKQEMKMVASVASLAKMVKTLIDTNILDSNGHVTDKSEGVILEIQDKMKNEDLTVRMPNPQVELIQQSTYQQFIQNINMELKQILVPFKQQVVRQSLSVKQIYDPNGFVKFIMWLHTIFYGFGGICGIFSGDFIAGTIVFAAGLMMCPKVNNTMKFWPRFGLMLLLLMISAFSM